MAKAFSEAVARVASLPPAVQEKIGEELLLHVNKVERLRAALNKGIQSLDRGEGRELNVEHAIKRARAQYGRN